MPRTCRPSFEEIGLADGAAAWGASVEGPTNWCDGVRATSDAARAAGRLDPLVCSGDEAKTAPLELGQ